MHTGHSPRSLSCLLISIYVIFYSPLFALFAAPDTVSFDQPGTPLNILSPDCLDFDVFVTTRALERQYHADSLKPADQAA